MSEELFDKMVGELNEKSLPGLSIRYTTAEDASYLKQWLCDSEISSWFPMADETEIQDAVMRWVSFHRIHSSITVEVNGVPAGIATLYLQAYRKLIHQTEFGIIVGPEFRNKGVGTFLLKSLMRLAKERFKIELLHLQVYAENPAIRLYKRMGFREFGRQSHWIKELDGRYVGRIFMERFL
jgi:RimJ/RimL family protein N-acetyltransferase